jgi:uncharacterized protein YecT (DUF1311 family)
MDDELGGRIARNWRLCYQQKMPRLFVTSSVLLASILPLSAKDAALPRDRAAIDGCLQKQKETAERCIGTVYDACTNEPSGSTTVGMNQCAQRELQVWQEKMAASLKQLLAGPLGATQAQPENRPPENKRDHAVPGSDIINDMQRTWVAARAKVCDTATLQYEGGTLASVVYGQCVYEETGRHALWLKTLTEDTH